MSDWKRVALEGSVLKQRDCALERKHGRWQLAVLDPGKLDGVDIRSLSPFCREQSEHVHAGHYLNRSLDFHHDTPRKILVLLQLTGEEAEAE